MHTFNQVWLKDESGSFKKRLEPVSYTHNIDGKKLSILTFGPMQ
jgi:hypothetical protein